jgi:hypothetical protein
MADDDLRERLADWARPFERLAPPDLRVIRRRARRRVIRRTAAGTVVALALGTAAALVLTNEPGVVHPAPVVRPTTPPVHHDAGPSAVARAPYLVTIPADGGGTATVARTATGTPVAIVHAPGGTGMAAVVEAGGPRRFLIAVRVGSGRSQVVRFYRFDLGRSGRPSRPRLTRVAPLAQFISHGCTTVLAGLAVTPDGQTLAVSTLSNCATGRAGPSRIAIFDLSSGRLIRTFRPGRDYPLSLSWSADGSLAYDLSTGVWLIPGAAARGHGTPKPRLLIPGAAGLGGFSGAGNAMITPDGSVVIATIGRGTRLEVAEFSARTGKALRVVVPAVNNPASYCGPLWTDASARHVLVACGQRTESSIDNGRLTRVRSVWGLPFYPAPGPPMIAW